MKIFFYLFSKVCLAMEEKRLISFQFLYPWGCFIVNGILFFLFIASSSCWAAKAEKKATVNSINISRLVPFEDRSESGRRNGSRHVMVVFIHGTILPVFSFSSIAATVKDFFTQDNENGLYCRYLNNLRNKSFYRFQPIGDYGLLPITIEEGSSGIQEHSATQKIASYYRLLSQYLFPDYDQYFMYTFGWEGRLDAQHRKKWAEKLYQSLVNSIEIKKKALGDGKPIEVHLIAHSHGGNVALNLASVKKPFSNDLVIENIVLLGTPIQSETALFATSPMFKNVFNLYSKGDMVQVVDIISTKDDWSARTFPLGKLATNYKHIRQFAVQVGKNFPRHVELWYWGSNQVALYRKNLAIRPYPVVCFVPLLLYFANNSYKDLNEGAFFIGAEGESFIGALHEKEETASLVTPANEEVIALNAEIVSSYFKLAFLDS